MTIDKITHEFFKNVIMQSYHPIWHSFQIDDQKIVYYSMQELHDIKYYRYYYAEGELYVIKDTRYNSIYFIYAKNPKEALKNFLKKIDSWRAENDKQQKIRK